MYRNYFQIALRSLLKNKVFSFINIAGLSVGMAGAILILLWLQNEVSFDQFHQNKDELYEVYGLSIVVDGASTTIPVVSQPLGPALQQSYPEVEATARVNEVNSFLLSANDRSFTEIKGSVVDPAFLQLFNFPLVAGQQKDQLKNVQDIVITAKLAKKLFQDENALGKIIKIDSTDNFTVTGILKDLPSNTRFNFEYLLPWDYLKKLGEGYSNESWLSNNTSTFVQLKPQTNLAAFNEKIKNLSREKTGRTDVWTHFLFPLRQWHLYSEFENGKAVGGRISTVRVFGLIAAFILLIACINFMNLSTAKSEERAKEVGIRKVAGAGVSWLIGQFIIEAFLTVCIAATVALLMVQLVLPLFNTLVNVQLFIPYRSLNFWLAAFTFIVFTSLLAGSYPAFYLSSFKPISIFKKQFKNSQSIVSPRKVLVTLQFTFAIVLIISTIIIRNQVVFAQDRDKGYTNNNLIQVNFRGDIDKNYALIKQELVNTGIATSVTKTMSGITEGGGRTWGLRWPNEAPKDTNTAITIFSADADLVNTAGLHLIEGRDIDINKYPADSFSVLLNETAVKLMGFQHPVGQIITQPASQITWTVVGVVKDYIAGSPYEVVPPTVIAGPAAWFNTMHIKFNPAHSTAENLAKAEQVFNQFNPTYPFDYQFVDQQYAAQFESEQRTKTMAGLFATLSIFICCLGLFGLSSFTIAQRKKEIGVRKVLGASVGQIVGMLSKDFLSLVVIAFAVAAPLAWYGMDKWLADFAYRINIQWWVFVLAGGLAVLIAFLTVGYQSVRAALLNPVKSLQNE